MTYPGFFSVSGSDGEDAECHGRAMFGRRGFLVADIMVAAALSVLFAAGMTVSVSAAEGIFTRAAKRDALVGVYEAHAADIAGLMPSQSAYRQYDAVIPVLKRGRLGTTTATVSVFSSARWYGEDMIETDTALSYVAPGDPLDGAPNRSLSSTQALPSLSIVAVRSYPYADPSEAAGTPLCSAEFGAGNVIMPGVPAGRSLRGSFSVTAVSLPVDPLLPMTDLQVRDGIAYISADSAKTSDPDFLTADISDPSAPTVLSAIDTGPGIAALALAGKYVFAAAASSAAQLQVIRLDGPGAPVLVAKYRLMPPEASSSMPHASAVAYDKGRVYLGTEKWDGRELVILDVSTPEAPEEIGGFETGRKVNSIYVRRGRAVVADSSAEQIKILDANNASAPVLAGSFSPPGFSRQSGRVAVSFEGSYALGRDSGGYDIGADHELFAWPASSTPPAPPAASLNEPGGVYGLVMDRNRIFAVTRGDGRELSAYERDLNASSPVLVSLPVAPKALTCDGDKLYVLAATAPVIYEFGFD